MSDSFFQILIDFSIIVVLFAGIRFFRSVEKARMGNLLAAFALLLAFLLVFYRHNISPIWLIAAALAVGSAAGYFVAMKVNMIQIPAMVAFQHGAGGIAVMVVSIVELTRGSVALSAVGAVSGLLGLIIGAATFSGSMIASGKLANKLKQTPTTFPHHRDLIIFNLACVVLMAIFSSVNFQGLQGVWLLALVVFSVIFGYLFSIRIGGADMPVLISFLNATAGLAAAFCGIIIENRLLIVCGATVAASGSILTHIMCKSMNRNLFRVFIKIPNIGTDSVSEVKSGNTTTAKTLNVTDVFEAACNQLRDAKNVIFIPGYGMAIAQAQFEVVDLAKKLIHAGKSVKFAIHPVAGRMPGHMNVLLAEADLDYDLLNELEAINPEFAGADVAFVVGACDVVNPAAISQEGTPISGMPILNAHEAKTIIVCNFDEKPGYSGVKNPLYEMSNSTLLFGDAKETVKKLLDNLSL